MEEKAKQNGELEKEMETQKISLEQYLHSKGVGFAISGYMLDKSKIPRGLTQRQEQKFRKEAEEAELEYQIKRQMAINEYKNKVKAGEITEPTKFEEAIRKAQGHPDNPSVQAARRMLKKRYGVDWENCL